MNKTKKPMTQAEYEKKKPAPKPLEFPNAFPKRLPKGRTIESLQEECDKELREALKILRETRDKIVFRLGGMLGVMMYGNGIGDVIDVFRLTNFIHHINKVESNLLDDTDIPAP